jgi:hypothetical protein
MVSSHLAFVSVLLGTYGYFHHFSAPLKWSAVLLMLEIKFPRVTYKRLRVHRASGYLGIQTKYESCEAQ